MLSMQSLRADNKLLNMKKRYDRSYLFFYAQFIFSITLLLEALKYNEDI